VPSTSRRTLLATAGTLAIGSFAGCSLGDSEPPAGSLRFENRDDVPHVVSLRVRDVGARSGPGKTVEGEVAVPVQLRELTAATALDPGERETHEDVFVADAWYALELAVDAATTDERSTVTYAPAPDGRFGRTLSAWVSETGDIGWTISSTDDMGQLAD